MGQFRWAAKLRPDAAGDHRLSADGAWAGFPLIAELEHTYATRHTRPTLGNITIYHTLLGLPWRHRRRVIALPFSSTKMEHPPE
ncbi:MAG: hypothetical protein U1E05_20440 [Patescibacteria group bacterium]|nr:hypothetical protein [Patescibacteria group bacterium]